MERYNGVELDPEGAFVYYDDAQRALDAAQARVKELELYLTQERANRDSLAACVDRDVKKIKELQAQLAAMTESRDAWRLAQECSEKAYMSLATQIPSERYDYDPVNLALLDGAKEQERIGRKQIADLQAQLRHMTKERDIQKEVADNQAWHVRDLKAQLRQVEGQSKTQAEEAVIVFAKYTTLRQLVAALPVVDVQEVSVWLSPDESGWLVSKRPAFPAGLYWAKFRTQAEADSFRALLAYRATLVAQDAGKATS